MYLLDTNVISEYRKGRNANWGVRQFFLRTPETDLFLPVQVLGEIQAGVAKLTRGGGQRELEMAEIYNTWIADDLLEKYSDRILEFDLDSAQLWGTLLSGEKKDPHTIDKQIAAMAITRDMTVVTRDKGEAFAKIRGVKTFNPFCNPPSGPNDETYALAA